MEIVQVLVPTEVKVKLEALRKEGYSVSGFVRSLIERELDSGTHPTHQDGPTRSSKEAQS